MAGSVHIMATYEALLGISAHMLEAARSSDWERLVDLETDCRNLVAGLRAQDAWEPLTDPLRIRKAAIIRKVLADDAEIRRITEPWMTTLQYLLRSVTHERTLQRAYRPGEFG
jgi:flagellar protein FliT